jgi:hypothetical protein
MTTQHRRGLLPDAGTQASLNFAIGDISRRIAYTQARNGIDPTIAARHATDCAGQLVAWVLFIAPMMGIFTLGALGSPLGMLLVGPLNIIGIIILIRIHTAIFRPADQRLIYAIPTWVLVVAGGLYVTGLFLLMVISLMRS